MGGVEEITAAIGEFCIAKCAALIGPAVRAANFGSLKVREKGVEFSGRNFIKSFENHVNVAMTRGSPRSELQMYFSIESRVRGKKDHVTWSFLADNFRDRPYVGKFKGDSVEVPTKFFNSMNRR